MTTTSIVLAIAAIVVSATVPLLVAYQHRRQMRQAEMYRQDPSVGLTPPPTRFVRWLSSYGSLVVVLAIAAWSITAFLATSGPIDRTEAVALALVISTVYFQFARLGIDRVMADVDEVVAYLKSKRAAERLPPEPSDPPPAVPR